VTGLDVILLPEELKRKDIGNCLVVVIDVLRASSTITTAFAAGVSKIIPVYLPEEAQKKAETYHSDEVLLCGERRGEKLTGFDLGNSPREYSSKKVKNKTILLTTTNGIRTIELVRKARRVIIGCFLNIQAIVQYCQSYSGDILLVCAGDRGAVSLEDTVCAGMIKSLCENNGQSHDNYYDDSLIALCLYQKFKNNLLNMMQLSIWGKHLIRMGFKQDLLYCAQENIYHYIPVLKDDSIVSIAHYSDDEPLK
jgi:2-phosphosulfolactate phosphatase